MIPFWKKTDKHSKPQSAQKRRQNAKPAVPRTAQQSIPMQRMFEDGTCRVKANYYTRTIQYQDINYQLAQQEDKTAIFEEWCSFLNFFDSSIKFELSFVNMATDSTEFEKSIRIPFQKDGFDDVRAEYSQMLRQQLAKGNNGLTKTKFITFGVEGESMAQVKPRLDHIQNDLLNNFHRLGVQAKPLNGAQRLKLMHDMFNMDGASKFHFDWKDFVKSGLSVKDAIAPTAFAFKNSRTFQMGGIFCAASFLSITASDISDQLLKDFLDMDSSQIVTMHIQSVDQNRAIKTVKRTITELDRSKIEEQKKAIRAGYDIDIIPSDLATYGRDAKALLKELQSQNERMFLVTFLVLNTGRTEQELENNVFQASSIAQKHNCNLCRLDFQQEQGLMSSLPLADCQIEIQRGLTTSSTAIFHAGFCLENNALAKYARPMEFEEVALRWPEVNLCLAHFGWPWVQETAALLLKYPNLYANTALMNFDGPYQLFAKVFKQDMGEYWLDHNLADKVMFGSDLPRIRPVRSKRGLDSVEMLPETREKIYWKNAMRFFGWEGQNK